MKDLKTTGVTKETIENMLVDAGAVYFVDEDNGGDIEDPDTWEIFGATRGGNEFTVEQEFRSPEVDGISGDNIKGMKRIINVVPQITANLLEITNDVFEKAFPGVDIEDYPNGEDPTHDWITREGRIELSDYIDYVVLVGEKQGSDYPVACYIENGLQDENIEISTEDEDESVIPLTFTGHYEFEDPEKEPWGILNPKPAEED